MGMNNQGYARKYEPRDEIVTRGMAFTQWQNVTVSSSQYPFVQLWNPANSGVYVYVTSVVPYYTGSAVIAFSLDSNVAALPGSPINGTNRKLGASASKAQLIAYASSTVPPLPVIQDGISQNGANSPTDFINGLPYLIPPGYGLTLGCFQNISQFGGTFQWFETSDVI